MKTFRKTPLSLAVAASLGMAVAAYDAGAVNVATDGIGEVAMAPYYTTRDGWMTLINLTNTEKYPIVVKVRVHEGENNRDVLDFNVALSANDQWVAVLKEKDGVPVLDVRDDDTCIIGSGPTRGPTVKKLNKYAFTGTRKDGGGATDDRLREGYIEFIVMGYTTDKTDIGRQIENHSCTSVRKAFTKARILTTARQFGEPINALKFNFRLLNPKRGMEAGAQAVTWANFFNSHGAPATVPEVGVFYPDGPDDPTTTYVEGATPTTNAKCTIDRGAERHEEPKDWDPATVATAACRNLITAQEAYVFLEPSLNDVFPRVGSFFSDKTNTDWTTGEDLLKGQGLVVPNYKNSKANGESRGVDAFSFTIQRKTVVNEWALEEGLGSEASWVVTFPTKSFYVDAATHEQAAIWSGADRWEAAYFKSGYTAGLTKFSEFKQPPYAPFSKKFNGTACDTVSFTPFDRKEKSVITTQPGGIIDSPAPIEEAPTSSLCYAVNVLNFGKTSGAVDGVLGSKLAKTVDVGSLLQTGKSGQAGWMELDLAPDGNTEALQGLPGEANDDAAGAGFPTPGKVQGLPAIGFMIKHRDLGDPGKNYVSTIEHGYTRSIQ